MLPEILRRTISDDLAPVRPLLPAWLRTLYAVAVAAAGLAIVVAAFKLLLRPDIEQLPMWLSWGCTAFQLVVGIVLMGMALREAVPGSGVPAGAVALAVTTGVVMQILVGIATWMHSPGEPLVAGQWSQGRSDLLRTRCRARPASPCHHPVAGFPGPAAAAFGCRPARRHRRRRYRRRHQPHPVPDVRSAPRAGLAHGNDFRTDVGGMGGRQAVGEEEVRTKLTQF